MALVEPEELFPTDFKVYEDAQTDEILTWAAVAGAIVAVVVVVVAYALPAFGAPPIPVTAALIAPDGSYETSGVQYPAGSTRQISTVVPNTTTPLTVQAIRTNPDGTQTDGVVEDWNIALTGYNYIISSNLVIPAGDYSVYTIVTFAGGATARSNTCTFTQL